MSTASSTTPDATEGSQSSSVDSKILTDLGIVKEKMDLCETMLRPGDGSPVPSMNNETLLAVIGFLEACAPRMVELVEAASAGALSEVVLMECLTVNDKLQKLLSDIDTYAATETPAATTAASAAAPSLEQDFGDLLLGDALLEDKKPAAPAVAGGKTTGIEEDPFGAAPVGDLLSLDTTPSDDAKMPAAKPPPTPKSDDEFGDFMG